MRLLILGAEEGVPFPLFGLQRAKGKVDIIIKKGVKGLAHKILWESSEKDTTKKTFWRWSFWIYGGRQSNHLGPKVALMET